MVKLRTVYKSHSCFPQYGFPDIQHLPEGKDAELNPNIPTATRLLLSPDRPDGLCRWTDSS